MSEVAASPRFKVIAQLAGLAVIHFLAPLVLG